MLNINSWGEGTTMDAENIGWNVVQEQDIRMVTKSYSTVYILIAKGGSDFTVETSAATSWAPSSNIVSREVGAWASDWMQYKVWHHVWKTAYQNSNLSGATLQSWVSICRKHKDLKRKLNNMKKHWDKSWMWRYSTTVLVSSKLLCHEFKNVIKKINK